MRKQDLNKVQGILLEIDSVRSELQRIELDIVNRGKCENGIWILPHRKAILTNLINNILQPELEQILRSVVAQPENNLKKVA